MKFNIVISTTVLLTIISNVNSAKLSCSDITGCDCKMIENVYSDIYNVNCPSINRTGSGSYKLNIEFFVSSYNSRVSVDCKYLVNNLDYLPTVRSPFYRFKEISFNNCFNNTDNSNYKFNLNNFISTLNIKLHEQTFRLTFNNYSIINDDYEFFKNFELKNFYLILIKNLGFNANQNYLLPAITNSTHLRFYGNNVIDFNSFAMNPNLMTLEIENNKITGLNKVNLKKFRILSKMELINCELTENDLNIDNLFESNTYFNEILLKNITMNGGVILHEQLLFGMKRMRILTITSTALQKLHVNLFSELNSLITLDLSNNDLQNLEMDTFKFNYNLQFLNLSGNYFMSFDGNQIFQQIRSLRKLYLDNNLLTKFYYNASGQNYFNELHLHNNQLSYDEDTACPFSNISARIKINVSSNKITNAAALLDCFVTVEGLTEMNLERNSITDVRLQPLTTSAIVLERLFDNLLLADNNITSIDILDEVDWDTFAGDYKKTNLIVDLDLNPLFCENCVLLKQVFNHSYVPVTSDYGTVIRFQHPHKCKLSVFCDEQIFYDHDYKCPESCKCRYNEFSRIILIDCINKGLTKFPVIDYTQLIAVDSFILNFKDNKITEFTTIGQNPEVFKRLKSINLENNAIKTFNLSLMYNKVGEILLKNNQLRITQEFLNEFNEREILLQELKMSLSGNDYCNNFDNVTVFLKAINFNLVDRSLINCVPNSTPGSTNEESSSPTRTGHSNIWILPVILLFLAIIVGYVYYRSQVRDTTARFINRFRYRKANVEFESNLIHEDS